MKSIMGYGFMNINMEIANDKIQHNIHNTSSYIWESKQYDSQKL